MGKPEIQHVKATIVYDGIAHDVFANHMVGIATAGTKQWFATNDQPATPEMSKVGPFETAGEAIGYLAADIVQRSGVVIS